MQKTAIKVTDLAFTCYPVTDLERARQFYEDVMGLRSSMIYKNGNNTWVEYDLKGNTFTLGHMEEGPKPNANGANVAFEVDDFDATVRTLKEAGVEFKMEPFETPGCHIAVVVDPEGNSLLIHKMKADRCDA